MRLWNGTHRKYRKRQLQFGARSTRAREKKRKRTAKSVNDHEQQTNLLRAEFVDVH